MKDVLRLLALAVALAALVVPGAQAANVTLVVTSYTMVTQQHDAAPKGKISAGDRIDFKDRLDNRQAQLGKKKGAAVGFDAGSVVYTNAKDTKISGVTTFPGYGTLTFAGAMNTRKDGTVHVAIVNGTGSFKGAKGTLIIGTGDTSAPNTYVLTLSHSLCTGACA